MDVRRALYEAAIQLAIVLSIVATVVALGLHAVAPGVPSPVLVLSVITVGFVTSWARSAHIARAQRPEPHRLAVVPLRHPVG